MLTVDVEKRLGDFSIAARFETAAGVTALFGPSGAGKSTLANMIAGLVAPDRGRITLDGDVLFDSEGAHRRAGPSAPHRLRVPGRPAVSASDGRAQSRLRPPHEPHCPRPGGASVASSNCSTSATCWHAVPASSRAASASASPIGRALLMRPRLLLLDEPLASLDTPRKREILPYLERLRDEAGVPMVYVSHHAGELRRIATTVVRLEDGTGVAVGGKELLDAGDMDALT